MAGRRAMIGDEAMAQMQCKINLIANALMTDGTEATGGGEGCHGRMGDGGGRRRLNGAGGDGK